MPKASRPLQNKLLGFYLNDTFGEYFASRMEEIHSEKVAFTALHTLKKKIAGQVGLSVKQLEAALDGDCEDIDPTALLKLANHISEHPFSSISALRMHANYYVVECGLFEEFEKKYSHKVKMPQGGQYDKLVALSEEARKKIFLYVEHMLYARVAAFAQSEPEKEEVKRTLVAIRENEDLSSEQKKKNRRQYLAKLKKISQLPPMADEIGSAIDKAQCYLEKSWKAHYSKEPFPLIDGVPKKADTALTTADLSPFGVLALEALCKALKLPFDMDRLGERADSFERTKEERRLEWARYVRAKAGFREVS